MPKSIEEIKSFSYKRVNGRVEIEVDGIKRALNGVRAVKFMVEGGGVASIVWDFAYIPSGALVEDKDEEENGGGK